MVGFLSIFLLIVWFSAAAWSPPCTLTTTCTLINYLRVHSQMNGRFFVHFLLIVWFWLLLHEMNMRGCCQRLVSSHRKKSVRIRFSVETQEDHAWMDLNLCVSKKRSRSFISDENQEKPGKKRRDVCQHGGCQLPRHIYWPYKQKNHRGNIHVVKD